MSPRRMIDEDTQRIFRKLIKGESQIVKNKL